VQGQGPRGADGRAAELDQAGAAARPQLSRTTLLSGTAEVEFNTASPRTRTISGVRRGVTTYKFDQVQNGEAATKQVALAAGTWKLWCNIPGHEQLGMVAYVTVGDG